MDALSKKILLFSVIYWSKLHKKSQWLTRYDQVVWGKWSNLPSVLCQRKKYLVHTLQNGKSCRDICSCQFSANSVSSVPEIAAKSWLETAHACLAWHCKTMKGVGTGSGFPRGRDSRNIREERTINAKTQEFIQDSSHKGRKLFQRGSGVFIFL